MSVLVAAVPAYAHASLVSTNPADGATMDNLPAVASATFNETIGTPAYLIVTAPNGEKATTGKPSVLDNTVSIKTKDLNIRGTYSLSYRVVSADSHPVEGTIEFQVTDGRAVQKSARQKSAQNAADSSFVERHKTHLVWGAIIVVVALGLLLWPFFRRRHD